MPSAKHSSKIKRVQVFLRELKKHMENKSPPDTNCFFTQIFHCGNCKDLARFCIWINYGLTMIIHQLKLRRSTSKREVFGNPRELVVKSFKPKSILHTALTSRALQSHSWVTWHFSVFFRLHPTHQRKFSRQLTKKKTFQFGVQIFFQKKDFTIY